MNINTNPSFTAPSFVQVQNIIKPLTAEEVYNNYKIEVLRSLRKEGGGLTNENKITQECEFHQKKLSSSCRVCKRIKSDSNGDFYEKNEKDESTNQVKQNKIDDLNIHAVFPVNGDSSTFNVNEVLRINILNCQYFKDIQEKLTFKEAISEIQSKVNHVEPWSSGSIPSTAFCLLYKFMCSRISSTSCFDLVSQVKYLMNFNDCVYVRCIGFLYVRYLCPPNMIWDVLKKYLFDEEIFTPGVDKKINCSISKFVEDLLTNPVYFSTRLPRFPIAMEKEIQILVLAWKDKKARRKRNLLFITEFIPGATVKALSPVDNKWHFGEIVNIDEDGQYEIKLEEKVQDDSINILEKLQYQFYERKIEANEVANEFFELHDLELIPKSSNQNKRLRSEIEEIGNSEFDKYEEEIQKKMKFEALASKREEYSKRPTSYKSSLSIPLPTAKVKIDDLPKLPKKQEIFIESKLPEPSKAPIENEIEKEEKSEKFKLRLERLKNKYGDASSKSGNANN